MDAAVRVEGGELSDMYSVLRSQDIASLHEKLDAFEAGWALEGSVVVLECSGEC